MERGCLMNEKYIIDRVEGKYAIVEKDKNFTLNRKNEMEDIMKDMWEE